MSAEDIVSRWLEDVRPGTVRELFEYLPNMLYFAKDAELRLMSGNRAFVQRCGFQSEAELVGKRDHEIFRAELAEKYSQDDRLVIASGKAITGIVELFPNQMGDPEWFVTDKVPLFNRSGEVAGLCGMVRSFKGAQAEIQPYLNLAPVIDYLSENYAEKVSVHELAKMAGLSVRQLERRFSETFQTTPKQYLIKLRVLRACDLLSSTTKPITEIALDVGFYDHSSFSKKFTQMMSLSPREYRGRFRRGKKK
ncbi:AraC family transcriptional regulator [Roseibacillus ishigakijimensis]|uniref:AraC family transcriptional regulator n=1 Tax=Roseibacillus ishigakijimensis TaxID=454146 RepID=A0A934VMG4_9BACT|nr:AraC family transcriptional regulator [Roseibacillus ishigakijimensis]MBK1834257.1 AraC family transcriptional regulator [Roseibacillus ishigakijimensis]